jgi:hypothetical protein
MHKIDRPLIISSRPNDTLGLLAAKGLRQEKAIEKNQHAASLIVQQVPIVNDLVKSVLTNSYNKAYQLCSIYRLDPTTWGLFDLIFRNYIVLKLQKVVSACPDPNQIPATVESKIKILKADALLCLRMAMKMREN